MLLYVIPDRLSDIFRSDNFLIYLSSLMLVEELVFHLEQGGGPPPCSHLLFEYEWIVMTVVAF